MRLFNKYYNRFECVLTSKGRKRLIFDHIEILPDIAWQIIDTAVALVKEDYSEELNDCIEKVILNYEDYGYDDKEMIQLIQEYMSANEILNKDEVIRVYLAGCISDNFFRRLNDGVVEIVSLIKKGKEDEEVK